MPLNSILAPERVLCNAPGASKKSTLQKIAKFITQSIPHLSADQVFDALISRERLGSTAIGKGIAIPHCRLDNCTKTIGALIKLQHAIDFDAIDNRPVDLIFVLLVPTEESDTHLQVLSMLASCFSNDEFCEALRQSKDDNALFEYATRYSHQLPSTPSTQTSNPLTSRRAS